MGMLVERGVTQHRPEAIVVACGDFRFVDDRGRLMMELELHGLYYESANPGIIREISKGTLKGKVFVDCIADYWKIGWTVYNTAVTRIVILGHEDCRAYGGSEAFARIFEREMERYLADMKTTRRAIENRMALLAQELHLPAIELDYEFYIGTINPMKTDDYHFHRIQDHEGELISPKLDRFSVPVAV